MLGFAIVTAFYLLGCLLQAGLQLPLPGNVIGLILFVVCLFLKWIRLEWVEKASQFLNRHMLLFFAPFVVGTIAFVDYIGANGLVIALTLIASTAGVLLVTGWTVKAWQAVWVRKASRDPGKEGKA